MAAIEGMLALRALAPERVEIELLGPERHFWNRPLSVGEPFGLGKPTRYEVADLVAAAGGGGTFTPGALEGVDASRHEVSTSVGEFGYDILLVAVGAVRARVLPGAVTFRGPADDEAISGLLADLCSGAIRRVAFAVPSGQSWPLPLYELALLTAAHVRANDVRGVELVIATPEHEPLEVFGPAAAAAVRELLEEQGILLHTDSAPILHADGRLNVAGDRTIEADVAVTLPRLRGPRLSGLPANADGFIPVDPYGRVVGTADVYAAGDSTDFPVKHGGIAAQLADAAAAAIAAQIGAGVEPEPFRPVVRALLLAGTHGLYLSGELPGPCRVRAVAPVVPSRSPAKLRGRYLTHFLAAFDAR
ncbi:MAG: FAD-dependent oxidoreductase [Gaiellaceae bacterium]